VAVAATALAMLAGTVTAVTAQAPAPAPAPKRTVIRPGRVLEVRTGEMRTGQAIVVEGDKITRVAASGDVQAAAGDTTIDLPEATLLPGLIDMHTHLTFELSSLGYPGLGLSRCARSSSTARSWA
jgi:imidazolonepropionase-like amidohydrolase